MACDWLAWGPTEDVSYVPWDMLDLPVRAINAIREICPGVRSVADVAKLRVWDLLRIPNCGRKSVKEIDRELARFGLALAARWC